MNYRLKWTNSLSSIMFQIKWATTELVTWLCKRPTVRIDRTKRVQTTLHVNTWSFQPANYRTNSTKQEFLHMKNQTRMQRNNSIIITTIVNQFQTLKACPFNIRQSEKQQAVGNVFGDGQLKLQFSAELLLDEVNSDVNRRTRCPRILSLTDDKIKFPPVRKRKYSPNFLATRETQTTEHASISIWMI